MVAACHGSGVSVLFPFYVYILYHQHHFKERDKHATTSQMMNSRQGRLIDTYQVHRYMQQLVCPRSASGRWFAMTYVGALRPILVLTALYLVETKVHACILIVQLVVYNLIGSSKVIYSICCFSIIIS